MPIPSGTLKPEKHNIVAPVPVLTTDHSHEPESELSETIAAYKPPGQEPHPDNGKRTLGRVFWRETPSFGAKLHLSTLYPQQATKRTTTRL